MRAATTSDPPPRATKAAAAGRGEDLNTNWKSALCVTSLYDSYVQLQQENDALKAQVQELTQQKNELLAARPHKPQRLPLSPRKGAEQPVREAYSSGGEGGDGDDDDDDDVSRYAQFRREIQLLRAEKEQLELVHTQYRKQSEAQMQEYKAQYNELSEKYQVRYALDPNGAKRVALAVQTLQETLEKVVHEKEELGLRYNKLQQLYNHTQQEQSQTLQLLQSQVQQLERKQTENAKKTVVTVVQRWYSGQLAFAWKQWTKNTALQRIDETEKHARESIQNQVKAKEKHQRKHRAARILLKFVQNLARRTFSEWRHVVQRKQETRDQISAFRRRSAHRATKSCFRKWKRDAQLRSSHRSSLERLDRVVEKHKTRIGWKKWTSDVFVNQIITGSQRKHIALSEQVIALEAELEVTRSKLAAAEQDNGHLAAKHDLERLELESKVHEKHSAEAELLKHIESYFAKQNDHQLLRSILKEWKSTTASKQNSRKHIKQVQAKLQAVKARRSVIKWYVATQHQRRYKHIVSHFLTRMRHIGVLQCLNAWKLYLSGKKQREATARKVILQMGHKHVFSCFEMWKTFKTRRCELRARLGNLCAVVLRRELSTVFTTWKSHISAIVAAEQSQKQFQMQRNWEMRFEQSKVNSVVMRRCLLHWRKRVQNLKLCKQLAVKTLSRWRNGLLSSVFDDWQRFVFEQQRQRELIAKWLHRYSVASLQSAWTKWQKQIALKTQQEILTQVREEHACQIAKLHQEIDQLQHIHQSLVADKAETILKLQLQLEQAQRATQLEAQRQEKYSLAFLAMAVQKERIELQLKWFKKWANQVAAAKLQQQIVLKFISRAEQRRVSTAFNGWNQLRKQRVLLNSAVKLLLSFMDQYRVIQSFGAWKTRMQSTRTVHHFQLQLQQRSFQRLCREILTQWKREARASFLVRRTAERIWLYSVHLRMKDLFLKWAAIGRHERFMEQKTKRKELLLAVQSQVFNRWTSCSLRVVFGTWRRSVNHIKRGKRAQAKLVIMQKMHRLSFSFAQLREYATLKCEQRNWLKQWMERRIGEAQERAFTLWKAMYLHRQRQENEDLRRVQAQLDSELLKSREEAVSMARSSSPNQEKLAIALKLVADSKSAIQNLSRETILERHFRIWEARVSNTKCVEKIVERLACGITKQTLASHFSAWKWNWRDKKSRRVRAKARRDRLLQALLSKIFYRWSHHVNELLRLKAKLSAIATRKTKRILSSSLSKWRSHVRLTASLALFVPRLDGIARRTRLTNGLARWRHIISAKKVVENQERDKQKRIMEFIMGRHGWNLERVFGSWRAFATAKRTKYAEARKRFAEKSAQGMKSVFAEWKLFATQEKTQRTLLVTLQKNFRVHYLRVALSKWRGQIYISVLEKLRQRHAAQVQQVESARHELTSKDAQIQRTQASLTESDQKISRLEGLLSSSSTGASQMQQRHMRETDRNCALVQVVLRKMVARQVLVAFARWKSQARLSCDQEASLLKLERILRRKQRGFAFSNWKKMDTCASRLVKVQQRMAKLRLHSVLSTWKSFCKLRMRVKVVLMRLCVIAGVQADQPKLTVCGAFRVLQKHSALVQFSNQLKLAKNSAEHESRAMGTSRKKLLLVKWSWRAYTSRLQRMHRFFSQCRNVATKQQLQHHSRTIQELNAVNDSLAAKLKKLSIDIQVAEEQRNKAAKDSESTDERSVINSSLPGLQTLFRQLAQVSSTKELFAKVSSTLPQILHGSSAVLFLHNPSSNELWTQREDAKVIQVPASLGIAGYTLSSCSTVFVEDVGADQRFHAMVDQFVLSTLRSESHMTTSFSVSSAKRNAAMTNNKPKIVLFSSALLSQDGSVFGVLQIALPTALMTDSEVAFATSQATLFGKLCCFYVEQMLFEIVRGSPDRIRARVPDKFIRLFKQNKNWRKYYIALERRAAQLEQKLYGVCKDRDTLVVEKAQMQEALDRVREGLESHKRSELEVSSQIVLWKKKMSKLKALVELKEREIAEKTREVEVTAHEFAKYRRQQRAKSLQAALLSSSRTSQNQSAVVRTKSITNRENEGDSSNSSQSLLRADNATLKNQLVRAESDSILLVQAIDVACKHHGELPDPMRMEVNRIASRLSHAAAG